MDVPFFPQQKIKQNLLFTRVCVTLLEKTMKLYQNKFKGKTKTLNGMMMIRQEKNVRQLEIS